MSMIFENVPKNFKQFLEKFKKSIDKVAKNIYNL